MDNLHSLTNRRRVRRGLIVSFDIARERDLTPSLAVGGMIAHARAHPEHGRRFELFHRSVALDIDRLPSAPEIAETLANEFDLTRLHLIALSAYVWSEGLIVPLMAALRRLNFSGPFALGGYQITRQEPELEQRYPEATYLIEGPGEAALIRALLDQPNERVLVGEVDANDLVSPYLAGVISVPENAPMVRTESQRGCRWQCTFCAHRPPGSFSVTPLDPQRIRNELDLFARRGVQKINFVDPEFNGRSACTSILRYAIERQITARLSLQTRPEALVQPRWGPEVLAMCAELYVCLEFGVQSIVPAEYEAVRRSNKVDLIARALERVNQLGIDHEASLIYGLPHQTVESFQRSIDWLRAHGVSNIQCYPLMLTHGTPLSREREKFGLKDEVLDGFGIRYVTSSNSFTRDDWERMRQIAEALDGASRDDKRPSPRRRSA